MEANSLSESLRPERARTLTLINLTKITIIATDFFFALSILFLSEDYIRYAHGLISDYIPKELSDDLAKYLK